MIKLRIDCNAVQLHCIQELDQTTRINQNYV